METTKTMRVVNLREFELVNGVPTKVEMTLGEDGGTQPPMETQRLTLPIADQRPVGTRYTVVTTYTEIVP